MEFSTKPKPRLIMAVTMEDDKSPWEAFSSWDGRKLVINRLASINSREADWQGKLSDKIKRLIEQNIHVVVEDRPGFVTGPAARLMLDDCGFHDGRTNFSHAMDWYYSLEAAGGLTFPSNTPANYLIDREKVERKKDDQGRTLYNPAWESFQGCHRVILLLILGAVGTQLTPNYLKTFAERLGTDRPKEPGPFSSLLAVTYGVTMVKMKEIDNWDKEPPHD